MVGRRLRTTSLRFRTSYLVLSSPSSSWCSTYLSVRSAGSCLTLEVISGPSCGLRCSVQSTNPSRLPLTLGRVSPSDLLIKDSEVSGKHALIKWNLDKMKWELVDMASLNGTLWNSKPINHPDTGSRHWGDPMNLANGDVITLGTASKVLVTFATMDHASVQNQVLLKLVVDKETNNVIFAQAKKPFIDHLLSFLTLPLGTIARLAKKPSGIGPVTIVSHSSLYQSVIWLSQDCMWMGDTCKDLLLKPPNSAEDYCRYLKFNVDDTQPTMYFVCSNPKPSECATSYYLRTSKDKTCVCGRTLNKPVFITVKAEIGDTDANTKSSVAMYIAGPLRKTHHSPTLILDQ